MYGINGDDDLFIVTQLLCLANIKYIILNIQEVNEMQFVSKILKTMSEMDPEHQTK